MSGHRTRIRGYFVERKRRGLWRKSIDLHDTEHAFLTVSGGAAVEEGRRSVIDNLSNWRCGIALKRVVIAKRDYHSQTKSKLCSPEAKSGSEDLLQGVRAELLVTV